jgi:hypothetical protein
MFQMETTAQYFNQINNQSEFSYIFGFKCDFRVRSVFNQNGDNLESTQW